MAKKFTLHHPIKSKPSIITNGTIHHLVRRPKQVEGIWLCGLHPFEERTQGKTQPQCKNLHLRPLR